MQTSPNDRQVAGTHYAAEYQHWDLVDDLKLNYFEGQITKYVSRAWLKNGMQDWEKGLHFLDKFISLNPVNEHVEHRRKASMKVLAHGFLLGQKHLVVWEREVIRGVLFWEDVAQLAQVAQYMRERLREADSV